MEVGENWTHEASTSPSGDLHPVALRFDEFGWQALEATAGRQHESIESLIADACSYLVVEIENERDSIQPPRFRSRPGGESRELELRLPARIWHELEVEAEAQGVELPRLVEHASLLYIADLDSGRAARRILDADDLED